MHQSRVYALLIDTPEAEAAPAAAFWSAALGVTASPVPQEPQFTRLHQALPGLVCSERLGSPIVRHSGAQ